MGARAGMVKSSEVSELSDRSRCERDGRRVRTAGKVEK